MNLARILNYLSYATVSIAYLVAGSTIHGVARCFRQHFNYLLPGKPLPNLTEFVLAYGSSGISLLINLVLASAFFSLLLFLEFGSEKRRSFIPLCLTIAFVLNFLQLGSMLIGVAMPSLYITYDMGAARH